MKIKNLADKIDRYFPQTGDFVYYDYRPNSLTFCVNSFLKWGEIKMEKNYSDTQMEDYFIEWIFWKFKKDITTNLNIHFSDYLFGDEFDSHDNRCEHSYSFDKNGKQI